MQVLPTLPTHRGTPFPVHKPVDIPQYSVDFPHFEPMELQVQYPPILVPDA